MKEVEKNYFYEWFKHRFRVFVAESYIKSNCMDYHDHMFDNFMKILEPPRTMQYEIVVKTFLDSFERLKSYGLNDFIDVDITPMDNGKSEIILHANHKNGVRLGRSICVNTDDGCLYTILAYNLTEFFDEFFYEVRKACILYEGLNDFVGYCCMDLDFAFEHITKQKEGVKMVEIKEVKFNGPATVVFWDDGTKTVVKCQGEVFDKEKGLAMAICKKLHTGKGHYYDDFVKYCKEDTKDE